jgi:cytidylate kinase
MRANEFITEAWSEKYKRSINCSNPKGFSQRAHCQGKKKTNEEQLDEKCWDSYKQVGMKKKSGKMVPNCVPKESIDETSEEQLKEGVNDPAIFKVVFVIGGPGSGKSYVSRKLGLNAMGFVTINSDVAFEYLMKKYNIDPKMPPEEEEKRNAVRSRAKEIATIKSDNVIEGRLGIHIDGTGDDYEKISNLKTNFESLGYDTALVIVNTKLEVAKQRNQKRERTVPEKLLVASWYNVQNNIGRFSNIFNNVSVIDNNASDDTDYTEQQINKTYVKLKKFATKEPTKPAAKEWIKKHSTVNDTEQLEEDLRKWFKEKWVRFGPDGKIRGSCARGSEGEGKPKCLPQKKAHALGKKKRASAASRKRRQDPNPERTGKAKNVATKSTRDKK